MEGDHKIDEEMLGLDNENEEEIDFVNSGGNNQEDDEFDHIVGTLQEIVIDNDFTSLQNEFFVKNCEVFEDVEENQIIHFEIFKKYQAIIEDFINNELKKRINGFDMKHFLDLLADRKNEIDEQLLEILFSFTEYQTFKEIMIDEKKRIEKERKKKLEQTKKKLPQKPLKQCSNNNTNIFSVDKKELFMKEEFKMDSNIKNSKNEAKNKTMSENHSKKEEKNAKKNDDVFEELSLDIISLTPQILKRKGNK